MRLWSLHPKYLDAKGLVALWREALLAQAVLRGRTKGYVHHPQLDRFRACASPLGCIAAYLRDVHVEAVDRGYHFTVRKIGRARAHDRLTVSQGQLMFEWGRLLDKVGTRDPDWYAGLRAVKTPLPHPLFRVVRGGVAPWERVA
jgi:hypothetical protein